MSAPLPPTKVLSSAAVLPSEAHTFLSTFILKADTDRHTSSRGNLVLSDQRRIEKALQGVFIPKPVEALEVARAALRTPVVTKAYKTATEEVVNDEEVEETGEWAGHRRIQNDEAPAPQSQSQSVGGVVDKEKRKADKKERLKDEKKQRAEERAKERQ
jgi:hypothetical protein